jgi:hypothetical protein
LCLTYLPADVRGVSVEGVRGALSGAEEQFTNRFP